MIDHARERLKNVLDLQELSRKTVCLVGTGGGADFAVDQARCGVSQFHLVDNQRVELVNIGRQGFGRKDVGRPKVDAVADRIREVIPNARVTTHACDFTSLSDADVDRRFHDVDLFIFATDYFPAQLRGNQVALRLKRDAIWVGLTAGAAGGEVFYWMPGLPSCFVCAMSGRVRAFERAMAEGRSFAVSSDGADIFSLSFVDAIAGHISLGLLTRGADNRFGRLIDQLDGRQYIQVHIDPAWPLASIVRRSLGAGTPSDGYFAWTATARRDPTNGEPPCADCRRFRCPMPDGERTSVSSLE